MFVRTGKDVPVRSNSSARPPLGRFDSRSVNSAISSTGSTSAATLTSSPARSSAATYSQRFLYTTRYVHFSRIAIQGRNTPPHTTLFPARARPSGGTAKQRPLSESRPARVTLRRNAHPGKPFPDSLTHDRRRPDDRPQNAMLGHLFRIGSVPSGTGVPAKPTGSDVPTIPAMPSGYRLPAGNPDTRNPARRTAARKT